MKLSKEVLEIINKIESNGYTVSVVGGCVRDFLLGKDSKDVDLATSAPYDKITEWFECDVVGASFGVAKVKTTNGYIDVAQYRADSEHDGRHCVTKTVSSFEEDCLRRDLTINAIAYNPTNGFIDYVGGIVDLQNSIVRFIGEPEERITEDYLRMLRFVRIGLQSFDKPIFESSSFNSVISNMYKVRQLSKERIVVEFVKILRLISFENLTKQTIKLLNIMAYEIFQFDGFAYWKAEDYEQNSKYHDCTLDLHTFYAIATFNNFRKVQDFSDSEVDAMLLALILHDVGKPATAKINPSTGFTSYIGHEISSYNVAKVVFDEVLKVPNAVKTMALNLIKRHMSIINNTKEDAMRNVVLFRIFDTQNFERLVYLQLVFKLCDKSGRVSDEAKIEAFRSFNEYSILLNEAYDSVAEINAMLPLGEIAHRLKNKEYTKEIAYQIHKKMTKASYTKEALLGMVKGFDKIDILEKKHKNKNR